MQNIDLKKLALIGLSTMILTACSGGSPESDFNAACSATFMAEEEDISEAEVNTMCECLFTGLEGKASKDEIKLLTETFDEVSKGASDSLFEERFTDKRLEELEDAVDHCD
ncbi:MAG: hypothetical protein HKN36_01195 [Hellea sp.]|nr:hypothetical protein [Hellea sp.]